MHLTHARLLVDDYPACFRFYRDVMRFTATYGWGIRVAHVRDPDGNLLELNQPVPTGE